MSELIDNLVAAGHYPHPVGDVVVKQTPLSWVVLAGEYAYKIRKPVKLSFVDLSTLERRRQDSLEEVRLSQRFAPQLYVDVVAISGSAQAPVVNGPVVNGKGIAIEYAVRMRRFASEQELTSLLERGEVTGSQLAVFGQRLARIHETSAACNDSGSAFAMARDNVTELQRTRPTDTKLDEIVRWTALEWQRAGMHAERRREAGKVRECHGDLHAGNIVELDGELTAFDCIEFNQRLRCIDVVSDVAFLFMDLRARAHGQLAYAFLNGWLEESGDYDAVGLLRFFAMYRALVRAKVAMLARDEPVAGRYVQLALGLTQSSAPTLMITCGLSGSGKTWFSSQMAASHGAVRIRSDVERKRMAGLRPQQSSHALPASDLYSIDFNRRVYAQLLAQVGSILQSGESVIVDAAFLKRAEREAMRELARQRQIRFVILYCCAPTETLRTRLIERQHCGSDASEADVSVMERQIDWWESFSDDERAAVIEVNTAEQESVQAALELRGAGLSLDTGLLARIKAEPQFLL